MYICTFSVQLKIVSLMALALLNWAMYSAV